MSTKLRLVALVVFVAVAAMSTGGCGGSYTDVRVWVKNSAIEPFHIGGDRITNDGKQVKVGEGQTTSAVPVRGTCTLKRNGIAVGTLTYACHQDDDNSSYDAFFEFTESPAGTLHVRASNSTGTASYVVWNFTQP
jgi:hypothetical protein